MRAVATSPPPERAEVGLVDGGRLHLRRATLADAPALFTAYASDPAATRFLSWPPRGDVEEVADWLAPSLAGWATRISFRWVLSARADGDAFGTVVLTATPRGWSIGYAVAVPEQGRGIAATAVRQVQRWAPWCLGPRVGLQARTDPAHAASIAVLRRCGFRLAGRELASLVRPTLGPEPRDALRFRWSPQVTASLTGTRSP